MLIIGALAAYAAATREIWWSRARSNETRRRLHARTRQLPDGGVPGYRALFLTAAMTGLRQGELIALRWRDVDWAAGRIRVRQNYVRGQFGTPKSRRSARSVPLADRVAGELERHHQASYWIRDDDLVFASPSTGGPLERSHVLRVFKNALAAARLDERHVFHDLRRTFGTRMAAASVLLRTLQEWMGHRDYKNAIYADYAPSAHERELVERAFAAEGTPEAPLEAPS